MESVQTQSPPSTRPIRLSRPMQPLALPQDSPASAKGACLDRRHLTTETFARALSSATVSCLAAMSLFDA